MSDALLQTPPLHRDRSTIGRDQELPPDASLGDVIEILNRLEILYTGASEADLFRQFGPAAAYFRRVAGS
jgi:hypothetical protein